MGRGNNVMWRKRREGGSIKHFAVWRKSTDINTKDCQWLIQGAGLGLEKKWTIFNGWTKWKCWKFSFSRNARIHGSRHRAAMPWHQQSRTAQARGDRMTCQCADDQQLYNCPTMTSWSSWVLVQAKRACAVQLAHPPSPVFGSRPPVSNVACLISLYLRSTCMYHTFNHITFLGYNHMNSRASVLLD